MPDAVSIPESVARQIEDRARTALPSECCGLLLGSDRRIVEAVAMRNAAEDAMRGYAIDPREHFQVLREARQRGLDVIGAYHSHPRSAARPSARDAAEAFSEFLFLIAGPADGPIELTAWHLRSGNFDLVPLVRTA